MAREAGAAILSHYGDKSSEAKADASPLTLADQASHHVLVRGLESLDPSIPIVSEEGELPALETRTGWQRFWLVDPLDGTKEFIKQTGEFTVNIGLIENGVPVLGIVYAPAIDLVYLAHGGEAWKSENGGTPTRIAAGSYQAGASPVFVASRDHAGPKVSELIAAHPTAECRSMGSSLKFCLVAEGAADLYLRDVPTMEWDTAAAHAIVLAAGAEVLCIDGSPLAYNKAEFRNPGLVTRRPGASDLWEA